MCWQTVMLISIIRQQWIGRFSLSLCLKAHKKTEWNLDSAATFLWTHSALHHVILKGNISERSHESLFVASCTSVNFVLFFFLFFLFYSVSPSCRSASHSRHVHDHAYGSCILSSYGFRWSNISHLLSLLKIYAFKEFWYVFWIFQMQDILWIFDIRIWMIFIFTAMTKICDLLSSADCISMVKN